jgi:hypothetical protein
VDVGDEVTPSFPLDNLPAEQANEKTDEADCGRLERDLRHLHSTVTLARQFALLVNHETARLVQGLGESIGETSR